MNAETEPSSPTAGDETFRTKVTRQMLRVRATEIALRDGRQRHQATAADWEQAAQELSVPSAPDANEAILEAAPESQRWDPVHGSTGHKVDVPPEEGEDEEGRSEKEQLVEGGVADADLDRMQKASEAEKRGDA